MFDRKQEYIEYLRDDTYPFKYKLHSITIKQRQSLLYMLFREKWVSNRKNMTLSLLSHLVAAVSDIQCHLDCHNPCIV